MKSSKINYTYLLKIAIFATGFSGIVAEYVLSTLATYFIGNSILQWTMIVSLMLFFMGLGSRLSKRINSNLVFKFILLEITLSVLISFSSILVYTSASFTQYYGFIIYSLSILIGLLIGLEIPLVIRINQKYEDFKSNISSVLEFDYYGSLLGGVFFAFIGLPYLGLTYTPFVLGFINLFFAILVLIFLWDKIKCKKVLVGSIITVISLLVLGSFSADNVIQWGEQNKYKDKVVFSTQSRFQKIVMTQWKKDYWFYLNGNLQFCTIDEQMYHEPLVHPAMNILQEPKDVLILGGGDGCAVRELLKYDSVTSIDLVDLDAEVTNLAKQHPILLSINQKSLHHSKVNIQNKDAFVFLENNDFTKFYDLIIIDLPDPRTIELSRLYSHEFYNLCYKKLRNNGVLITQAGSPYYATKAFECINKTMQSARFKTVPMHNQILSMGEWGWILGVKNKDINSEIIKNKLQSLTFDSIKTHWINNEAMKLLTSFGKSNIFKPNGDSIQVNKINDPVLQKYYLKGNWEIY